MDWIITTITNFWKGVLSFFSSLWSIISWWISIIQAIFYWLTSLLSKVWDLAIQIFDWWVFTNVGRAFEILSAYIWWPATAFLGVMLFLIIVRIAIAFVFKIFRLNIDYHTDRAKTDKINAEEYKKSHNLFS